MGIAWVFPGQGSQSLGMAKGVMELPGAKERFAAASELLGRDLLAICNGEAQGELVDLNDTRNTQPALFVIETLLVDALRAQGRQAQLVAGHSLGELVALYAAGVFDATTGLRLIHSRSSLMASAGGGAMTAVIGFDRGELEALVAANDEVVIANDNSKKLVIDLALPTDIAPEVVSNFDMEYVDMVQIQQMASTNIQYREQAIVDCEPIIQAGMKECERAFNERKIENAMRSIPDAIKEIKSTALGNVFAKDLEQLDDNSKEVLEKILQYVACLLMNALFIRTRGGNNRFLSAFICF
jgi:hypothetical protein